MRCVSGRRRYGERILLLIEKKKGIVDTTVISAILKRKTSHVNNSS